MNASESEKGKVQWKTT